MTKRAALLSMMIAGAVLAPAIASAAPANGCEAGNGDLALSPGFCAGVFADNIGHARHMAVAPDGTVFVNTWSGRYYSNDASPSGGFIVALKDTKGTGKADSIRRYGEASEKGAAGGTGIAIYNKGLYVEEKGRILRYELSAGVPTGAPATVISDLPLSGDHPMHPFVIDAQGNLYVDLGSATNACQKENRQEKSPGLLPCLELETRAGVWRYSANKRDQKFSAAERYSTGIRNAVGLAFDSAGRLFVTQHGRDQLSQNWPTLFTAEQNAELPAEVVLQLESGGDYGWPQCYYDEFQKKLVLAPEYGGDGKAVGLCAEKKTPVVAFPGHWGPNDLLIASSSRLPAAYRGGMFIAFHGSWNRAPLPQQGYAVVYQPLTDGKASGHAVVFANGFIGDGKDGSTAAFRPSGLAMAHDGTLYIADDKHGRIWRVTFIGNASTATVAGAPGTDIEGGATQPAALPESTHADAGRADTAKLPVPEGSSLAQVVLGDHIFHGEEKGGTCSGCHGITGAGTPSGSSLIGGSWLWGDGSLAAITHTITSGVAKPKQATGVMPPKGGVHLSQSDIDAVAAYVWAIGHANGAPKPSP